MRNHKELSIQELESMLNPTAAIAILQNAIDMEAVTKSVNSILDNDIEFLTCDYKISQAQILLSLLRMRQRL
jgi:ABC-type xylose transport system substrate-binding protein